VWKAIEDGIKTMLTPYGRVVVTPATGTITVDDTPPSLDRIGRYVHEQNAALTRQVVMNVRVLSVELSDSDSYGVNWDAIYKNIGRGLGVALNSVSGLPGGSSTLSFNVINTSSMWDGTQAILEALSKQGRVSQITSASIVTINNQPAPIQVGRQRSYLASSTTTLGTGGSGNTTTLVPGVVTTGFSMSVLPHILDNGRMMLQYAGDVSSLLNIDTVSSNGSSIQTPEIDTRNFLQRVMMKNGETLVLTGFEQFETSGNKQGIGSPENLALGGSARSSKNKTVLVVLIQPVMMAGEQ
jgi:type IVB pilus formation R64 PilN family outer membrane protein